MCMHVGIVLRARLLLHIFNSCGRRGLALVAVHTPMHTRAAAPHLLNRTLKVHLGCDELVSNGILLLTFWSTSCCLRTLPYNYRCHNHITVDATRLQCLATFFNCSRPFYAARNTIAKAPSASIIQAEFVH